MATAIDPYEAVGKSFAADTAEHEMTILLDQGLHRHVRFAPKGGSSYWYELITVPNALIFRGGYESLVFSRERDMFGFFRSNPDRLTMRISPDYWAEKLTSDRGSVKSFSEESFVQQIKDTTAEAIRAGDAPRGIAKAVRRDILDSPEIYYEDGARQALYDFEHKGFQFADTWEWDFREFDHGYLWACHAIVAGIRRYDMHKAQARHPEPVR